jgi:L-amino acid ligase
MNLRKNVCVIVDSGSTSRLLAPSFAALGYSSVHVKTPREGGPPQLKGHRADDFIENIDYDGDFDALADHLASKYAGVRCVVPGLESGVMLADRLSERLGVPTNGSALSLARRDKYAMACTVARHGLEVIPVLKTDDAEEACRWGEMRNFHTLVLKPKSSSGTYGFNICSGDKEVCETFARLLGSRDIFGEVIDEVLVQPLIPGQEYAVNTVSVNGRHYVTDIWRTDKSRRGQSKVYDKETLVYTDEPCFGPLREYVCGVLDALAIRHGPSHTEVMLTPAGQLLLIECAARLMGTLDVSMVTQALGHNAVQLTAESYLVPERLARRLDAALPPQVAQACMVQMLSTQRGTLRHVEMDALCRLPSFHGIDLYQHPGDTLKPTIDSYSSPGIVFLSHPCRDVIDQDYRTIRELEEAGSLYLVD